jgi:hypothetical protein
MYLHEEVKTICERVKNARHNLVNLQQLSECIYKLILGDMYMYIQAK